MSQEVITLLLNTQSQLQGIKNVVEGLAKVKSVADNTGNGLVQLGSKIKSLLGPLAGALSGYAILRFAKATLDNADALSKASQAAGVAVKEFSGLAYAGDLANVSQEQLVQASKFLGQWMEKTGQQGRDFTQVLLEQADVFSRMPDGPEKVRMAIDRFGKSGQQMIPLLNQGSQAIREQMQELDAFGAAVGPGFSQRAQQFNDNLTRLKTVLRGLFTMIADALLPVLIMVQEKILAWVVNNGILQGTVATLKQGLQGLAVVALTAYSAIDGLKTLIAAPAAAAGAFSVSGSLKAGFKAAQDVVREEGLKLQGMLDAVLFPERMAAEVAAPKVQGGAGDSRQTFEDQQKELDFQMKLGELELERLKTRGLLAQVGQNDDGSLQAPRRIGTLKEEADAIRETLEAMRALNATRALDIHQAEVKGDLKGSELAEKKLENDRERLKIQRELLQLQEQTGDFTFTERLMRNLDDLSAKVASVGAQIADVFTSGIMDAINTVADGMWRVIDGTATWGQLFQQVGRQIISDLIRIGIQEIILANLKRGLQIAWTSFKIAMGWAETSAAVAQGSIQQATEKKTGLMSLIAAAMKGAKSAAEIPYVGWILAIVAMAAIIAAGMALFGGFEKGGVVRGGRQTIMVNEAGTESVLNARATAMLGENAINALNAGIGLESRIASNMSVPSRSFASADAAGGKSQPIVVNLVLVDSRNAQAARDFVTSSEGQVVIADVVRNQKMAAGIK